MPKVNINQDFYMDILGQKPETTTQYYDKDIPNFMLEHRPSGATTWYYRYENSKGKVKFYRLGKNRRMDAVEARRQAYIAEMAVAEGKDPGFGTSLLAKEKLTLQAFVETKYLPFAKLSKRSWKQDIFMLKKYIYPHFAQSDVHVINSSDILTWQQELSNAGLSSSSCNRILAFFRSIFSALVRFEIIEKNSNPCNKINKFKELPVKERYLSQAEVKKMLAYLDASSHTLGANYIKLLLFTGARRNEILQATWDQVDFQKQILTVPLSKSGKARYIALSREAIAVLENLPRHHEKWLFPDKHREKPMSCPYYLWDKMKKACDIKEIRLHDLRHSYASFMVNNGCSLYEVQKVLGHSDPRVTQRYAHLDTKAILSAVNKTGKAICRK